MSYRDELLKLAREYADEAQETLGMTRNRNAYAIRSLATAIETLCDLLEAREEEAPTDADVCLHMNQSKGRCERCGLTLSKERAR